jgi:RimJ/RimL family protein N-acetyltransferase
VGESLDVSELDGVRARYVRLHGDHPMTDEDVLHVRTRCQPLEDPAAMADVAAGRLPPPAYVLPDGTPMVRAGALDPVTWAGGVAELHDWFVGHWAHYERHLAEQRWEEYLAGRWSDLDAATPTAIRRWTTLTEQVEQARTRLDVDPRDPVARGSLAEAVEGLDRLLAPTTAYDRLRWGGATPRDRWVDDLRQRYLTRPPVPLPLRTERLVLRAREEADTPDLHRMYGDREVTRYLLHHALSRGDLEDRLRRQATDVEEDALGLVVELDGRVVGQVALIFRGATQSETAWTFHPDVSGRGIATEAARALIDLGFRHFGHHRIYAELDARNTASARLCERLGMRLEAHRLQDYWSKGEWTDTLQYAVLASEWD